MKHKELSMQELIEENRNLKERLFEAEQTIQAIRGGEVDALIVYEPAGEQLYTLKGADYGYRVLVESINEGALILSPDNSIYYCNHRFAEMLDLPTQQIIGATIRSFVIPELQLEVAGLILESRNCAKAEGQITINRSDGTLLPIKLSLNCVSLEDFHGICAVLTDLSLQKRTELELRTGAEKLKRSNEELKEFVFIASHDLQEPLRKIQAFGNRLERTCKCKLNDSEADCLTRMQNSAKWMQQLINDLLNYSRLLAREEPQAAVDLLEVAEQATLNLKERIKRTGAIIDISDLPSIKAERSQMEQLFQNLIANSLKFRREENPSIKVYSHQVGEECRIFIEDNGIGFNETYLERIFMPFQRLHGRDKYEGAGMGLTICRKIVERHGGSITAKSTPGVGSTFIVTLPLAIKNS